MKRFFILVVLGIFPVISISSQVIINEIFATNNNALLEKTTFNFACYIELFNKGSQPAGIGGFYVTNKLSEPMQFRLPWSITLQPGAFYVVYTDELGKLNHANFRLDADGGKLFFFDRDLNLLDSFTYGKQFPDLPFGQKPDGSGKWTRLAEPTPGSSNNNIRTGDQVCPKPVITPKAGFYSGNVRVTIQSNLANAKVRYTTDGSEPTESSPQYNGPFTVSSTTIVKARNFHATYLTGATTASTFLINERKSHLPMVSVSLNPEYLNDDSIGIYVEGKNGTKTSCPGVANWNQDWKRPAFVEFFTPGGELLLTQGIDLKIAGGCTRALPLKSLGLMPSSRYSTGNFDLPFFESKPMVKGYGSLLLRNSGNDFNMTMFRDALLHELCIHHMDVDYQAYQPVAVYLNGEYLSLMNLREKVDKNYFRVNQSLPIDSVILLEKNMVPIFGSNKSFAEFIDSLNKVDITTPEGFRLLDRHIDLDEFLNYLAVQIYIINKDWPGNNYKFWKSTKPGSKWRWILTDLDFGFGLRHSPLDSTLYYVTETAGPFWPNPPWSTLLIRKIFDNPVTRNMFIQKMQVVINTIFSDERVNSKIDSIKNLIAAEMPYHWQRYGGNEETWNRHIDHMRSFNRARREYMTWHLKQFFNLEETRNEIVIKTAGEEKANYFVNNVQVSDTLPKEYAPDIPLVIEARPAPGYEFDGWTVNYYKTERVTIFPRISEWKYYDGNPESIPANWKETGFDDSEWKESHAEFGYGDNDENTVLNFGTNANSKFLTAYFRKKVEIDRVDKGVKFKGELLFDDGAVVYLNGKEIYRVGMPQGGIAFNTLAMFDKEDNNYYLPFEIPDGILKSGENTFAVEIHQYNGRSPDLSFDMALFYEQRDYNGSQTHADAKLAGNFEKGMELRAKFNSASPLQGLLFNEVSASNKIYPDNRGDFDDWIEIYNAGTKPVNLSRIFIEYDGPREISWNLSPVDTFLKPGSFAIFWADDEVVQGINHLPFRLSGNGEVLRLVQPVGNAKNILDTFKVVSRNPGVTVGRFPDGTHEWFRMAETTPGKSNAYQITNVSEKRSEAFAIYPNPANRLLTLNFQNHMADDLVVTLSGTDGRIILSEKVNGSSITLDVSKLNAGVYFLKAGQSNATVHKVVIAR